jgi:transcriptional regulator with XRE-family HTH domain
MTGGKQGARGFDAARLRECRLAAGLTQRQVARAVDVSESVVAHWERGSQRPTVEHVAALARALGVTPADLTTYGDESGPASLMQLREAAGLKQARLAARAGLTRTKYSSLERGEVARLSREDADRLAEVLGVPAEEVHRAHVVMLAVAGRRQRVASGSVLPLARRRLQ